MKIFYKSQKIFFGKPKCENVLTFFYFFLVDCCVLLGGNDGWAGLS